MIALFEVEEWVDRFRTNVLFKEQDDNSTSPICKVRLIGNLYFNELKNELSAFNAAHSNLKICILNGNLKLIAIKNLKVDSENKIKNHLFLDGEQEHQALLKEFEDLTNQQKNILQLTTDEFFKNYKELLDATRTIEIKANLLMNEITGVDFEKDLLN